VRRSRDHGERGHQSDLTIWLMSSLRQGYANAKGMLGGPGQVLRS